VVAGTIPIDLLAAERRTGSSNTIEAWQRRWNNATTGRWTHRLIPSLAPWLQRRHGQVDFYLTQMISGHGCLKEYLHRFNHEPNPYCDHCGTGSIEDAKHALFICPLFVRYRAEAETTTVCNLTADNVISCMLESQSKWDAIANMAAGILKELRRRERSRRIQS